MPKTCPKPRRTPCNGAWPYEKDDCCYKRRPKQTQDQTSGTAPARASTSTAAPKRRTKPSTKRTTKRTTSSTVAELRAQAKAFGMRGYSKLKKDQLVRALESYRTKKAKAGKSTTAPKRDATTTTQKRATPSPSPQPKPSVPVRKHTMPPSPYEPTEKTPPGYKPNPGRLQRIKDKEYEDAERNLTPPPPRTRSTHASTFDVQTSVSKIGSIPRFVGIESGNVASKRKSSLGAISQGDGNCHRTRSRQICCRESHAKCRTDWTKCAFDPRSICKYHGVSKRCPYQRSDPQAPLSGFCPRDVRLGIRNAIHHVKRVQLSNYTPNDIGRLGRGWRIGRHGTICKGLSRPQFGRESDPLHGGYHFWDGHIRSRCCEAQERGQRRTHYDSDKRTHTS